MLVELKKLEIINEGHRRGVSINKIYVNPSHVISIRDYSGANSFLLSEGKTSFADKKFSLVKMNNIQGVEEVIVVGTSKEIYESFNLNTQKKDILHG